MRFKYQKEIQELISIGCKMPELHEPPVNKSYRFVFANSPERNHIPPYVMKPSRVSQGITKEKVDVRGFALSNFESEFQATDFYNKLHKQCKNISKQIGDTLSCGEISAKDGMVTDSQQNGHFDLFESESCNLGKSFNPIKSL